MIKLLGILFIIELYARNNTLSSFYHQTDGCTLGDPFFVNFSNAYMLNLENNQNVVDTQGLLSVNCFSNPNLRVEPFYYVC